MSVRSLFRQNKARSTSGSHGHVTLDAVTMETQVHYHA
jgi:hypothetical protein